MTPEEHNFKSRLETLDLLYKRFREGLHGLDFYSAVAFSSPMADALLSAISQLDQFNNEKKVDSLISEALSKSEDN